MKIFICFVLLTICLGTAHAQSGYSIDSLKISDINTPTSPGFVLGDVAPSAVGKPTTPRALAVNLLNLWEGGSVEVTPYWLAPRPRLTFDNYLKKGMPFLQTLNFSVSSFKTDTSSNVSAGFRFHLLRIYSNKVKDLVTNKKDEIVGLLAVENPDDIDTNAVKQKNIELAKLFDINKGKGVFVVEAAGALLGSSSTKSFENLSATKSGLWANIRWSPYWESTNNNASFLSILAVSRYIWAANVDTKIGSDSAFFDNGLALNFQKNRFDLSVEYVSRRDISLKRSYDRFALIGNYMINDNIVVVASLGKNFDNIQDIIALFGVKFALSRERILSQ